MISIEVRPVLVNKICEHARLGDPGLLDPEMEHRVIRADLQVCDDLPYCRSREIAQTPPVLCIATSK